jgi:uncharacterized protein (TIRG00374 family)
MTQASSQSRVPRWLALGGKGAISGLLLWILFRRMNPERMADALAQIRWEFFLLALALYLSGQLLSALRWQVLLRPLGLAVSYARLVALYLLGMFFNFFLPTVIGGDAVKAYYLARETQDSVRALASVFMDRNTGLGALLLIAFGAAAIGHVSLSERALVVPLGGVLLVYLLLNLLLFAEAPYRACLWLLRVVRLRSAVGVVTRAHAALVAYRSSPASIGKALGLSFVFHLLLIGLNYANARALGVALDILALSVFIPIISLLSMLPITMYGLGVREYAFVVLFSSVGLPREASLLLALLWFLVTLLASVPGAFLYVAYRSRPRHGDDRAEGRFTG